MASLILYSYFRSSASFRARIALNLKNLAFEYRAVHLLKNGGEQFSADYARLNPSRQVPTLLHGDHVIAQSMAILDYLDSLEAKPRLFPADPAKRALVIQACEIINSGTQPFVNTATLRHLKDSLGLDEAARTKWMMHWLQAGSRTIETFIAPHAAEFAIGSEVSAADCFILPHLVSSERFGATFDDCPTLSRLRKTTYTTVDAFVKAMPANQPDFEA